MAHGGKRARAGRRRKTDAELVADGGGVPEIEKLLATREPLYRECATLTIDTSDETTEEIVERICGELRSTGYSVQGTQQ